MARELVNLSTENEKLKEKTVDYPILNDKYKVCSFITKDFFVFNDSFLGLRKPLRCSFNNVWRKTRRS